jgi:hypothetical protein
MEVNDMAYLIYRCDCGRVLYSKEGTKNRKCTCGKTLNVRKRRILKTADTAMLATQEVQNMQEEIYGGSIFKTADQL